MAFLVSLSVILLYAFLGNVLGPLVASLFLSNEGEVKEDKTGVTNDPLAQAHSLASSKQCFHLKFVLFCYILKSGDVRTTYVKTMITTNLCCWLAEWIKNGELGNDALGLSELQVMHVFIGILLSGLVILFCIDEAAFSIRS